MNYLNIRPNTLPKKNRFIWLFFIAASLYSLLSATAHAANCTDAGATLPRDITLTYHPNKGATSATVVAKQKIKCEITGNDDNLTVNFVDTHINNISLQDKIGKIEIEHSKLYLEYAISFSTTDKRCNKTNDMDKQSYHCIIKNDADLVINFEYTVEMKILKPFGSLVGRKINIPVSIYGDYSKPGMNINSKIVDFNSQIKVTYIAASCSLNTSNINFDLGEQKLTDFTHIGAIGSENKKRIGLSCSPDTKYSLQVDGITEPNHPGVVKLTPEPGAASGVGVQLLANNKEIEIGKTKEMGTSASASSGTNLQEKIDITARYYQTENKVTPGSANASATFTMTYQ
ncbi:fimbrial protein [Yersinia enterocolitica]|uniref:fimbrial protein n=1 Tax=Yersinia enterocolitica TaxID=630 RepID=UPI00065A85D3|nr:fimbrial protein [Yersinia enterocolitica]CRY01373.1 putative fimbrial subunit [Yersinia enterocolitica]